jgi:hypothetical protein
MKDDQVLSGSPIGLSARGFASGKLSALREGLCSRCIIECSHGFWTDFGAAVLKDLQARRGLNSSFRIALVCLAISFLTVGLATRFAVGGSEISAVRTVQAHTPDAQRQHLLSDGLKWTAPTFSFTLFEPPYAFVYAVSAIFPCTNLCSESWLYNRPPPNS